jgi:hypothetical protein
MARALALWHTRVVPTASEIRKAALALDGVSEIDHWGRPAFRTKKRIFAVIRPDGLFLHLPEERKEFLFEADRKTFMKYMWGKRANVIVDLKRIKKQELDGLIREAWTNTLPIGKPKQRQR